MAGILARALFSKTNGRSAVAIGFLVALAACNPIDSWRDLNGISKNDPGPEAPFGRDLAAAEAAPYPNLATVPPPPTREMTVVQRQRLMQSLVADRTSAEASDQRLRADYPAPPVAAGPVAAARPGAGVARPAGGPAPGGEAPPTSLEASLAPPQLPPPPEPEAFTPAPPPPQLPPPPVPAAGPGPAIPAAEAMAAAGYQPAPPPPALPPPPLPAAPAKPVKPVVAAGAEPIGDVDFPGNTTQLAGNQPVLDRAVAAYRGTAGHIRIVGHAGRSEGAVAQLDSFRAALNRAQAVAAALTRRGIPADKIRVEAAPAAGETGRGRAEVLLER